MKQEQSQHDGLNRLYSSIDGIRYFFPDNKPHAGWSVHYGSTLTEARKNALSAVHEKRIAAAAGWNNMITSVEEETKDTLENIKRLVPVLAAAADAARATAAEKATIAATNAKGITVNESASEDAGRDAAMMAELLVVKDLNFPDKMRYLRHADERMMAWKKGYGVLTDIDGRLYVYCVNRVPEGIAIRNESKEEEPEMLYAS